MQGRGVLVSNAQETQEREQLILLKHCSLT